MREHQWWDVKMESNQHVLFGGRTRIYKQHVVCSRTVGFYPDKRGRQPTDKGKMFRSTERKTDDDDDDDNNNNDKALGITMFHLVLCLESENQNTSMLFNLPLQLLDCILPSVPSTCRHLRQGIEEHHCART